MTTAQNLAAREAVPEHEQKRIALGYLHDAWIEALHDGIDGDCLAQTALFLALAASQARKRTYSWSFTLFSNRLANRSAA